MITTAVVATVVAWVATVTNPALGQSAPTASPAVAATGATEVAESPYASTGPQASGSIQAGSLISRILVGDPVEPRWFAADDQSLWVHEPTSLVRVDLATSAVTGQVPMYTPYGYVATGAGAVWQSDFDHDTLLRIDPLTDKVVASIPVGGGPEGVAVFAGAVWVADEHDEAVTRVDPATNTVVATIPIGPARDGGPQLMTAGPGGVWVDVPNMGEVVRIDPATNSVGLRVPLEGPVASDGQEVWISVDGPSSKVVRIDPVSGRVVTTADLAGGNNLAVGLGSVWVGGATRVDEATGQVVGSVDLGGDYGDVVVAGGSVWVTADGRPYVVRIAPY
jgi:YVTN family beta-propeller protein